MKFVVTGEPVAQKRHRHSSRGGFTRTYNPNEKDKEQVQRQLIDQVQGTEYVQLDEPLHLDLTFFSSTPKTCSISQKNAKLWGFGEVSRCDLDNKIKFLGDCGNGILYSDDRYIVSIKASKKYSENPRTEIIITPMVRHMTKEIYEILTMFTPDQLRKFKCDAYSLANNLEVLEDCIELQEGLEQFSTAACENIEQFAIEYADILKKIAKKHEKRYSAGKIIC